MSNINRITMSGFITADCTVKRFDGGEGLITFSLASNDNYRQPGSDKIVAHTTFIDCQLPVSKNNLKLETKLLKGTKVYVDGRIRLNTWEHEGRKIYKYFIKVSKIDIPRTIHVEDIPMPRPKSEDDLPF